MKDKNKDLNRWKNGDFKIRKFEEPKLKFIKPKLTKHGDATKITAGFFGQFSP